MLFQRPSMKDREAGDTLDELIAGPDRSFNGLHVVSCISFISLLLVVEVVVIVVVVFNVILQLK